jgi:NAD(P)-dependent dehydrogenase (short-subunit alcohol dehydrogenase family)
MQELGRGRVISITSEWGRAGRARATAYSASKAGIISLTKSLARTLGQFGITVNAISPGIVDTEGLADEASDLGLTVEALKEARGKTIPLQRVASVQDIANMVEYIASDAATSLTGQTIGVNGGGTTVWA